MTEKTKENLLALLIAALLGLLALMALGSVASCTHSRKSSSSTANDTQVKKADSGTVSKSSSTSSNENTWFKEWIAMGGRTDSFVSKEVQLQPIYHNTTQPVLIYREGGTNKTAQSQFNQDSAWKAYIDSTNRNKTAAQSSNTTQVLSMWQIIGISFLISLALKIIPTPTIAFKK